jgi:hypothetical protein
MQLDMTLTWIGALLVMGGVLYGAAAALRRGRLSEAHTPRATQRSPTLEPSGPGARLRLRSLWPALAIAALGVVLLLAGAMDWSPAT